jgi:hypothetical protein
MPVERREVVWVGGEGVEDGGSSQRREQSLLLLLLRKAGSRYVYYSGVAAEATLCVRRKTVLTKPTGESWAGCLQSEGIGPKGVDFPRGMVSLCSQKSEGYLRRRRNKGSVG